MNFEIVLLSHILLSLFNILEIGDFNEKHKNNLSREEGVTEFIVLLYPLIEMRLFHSFECVSVS